MKQLVFLLILAFFSAAPVTSIRAALAGRPNVLILLTDDQGTLDAHCFGSEDLHTPHIDRLADGGLRFTQAYAHAVCCPARAALLTGRHPQRGNVNSWMQSDLHAEPGLNMSVEEITLAEVLKTAGYSTALFGKWHLGAHQDHGPLKQGFDEFFGIRDGFIDNHNHFYLHREGFHDLYEGTTEVFARGQYFPELMVNRALKFLDKQQPIEQPFCLYVPFNIPHYPEQSLAQHRERYRHLPEPRRSYAAMISTTDDYIGRVLNKLEELSLKTNTVVLFLSDNGHSEEQYAISTDNHNSGYPKGHNYGANGGGGNTGKWIGRKGTFLEGGIRTPAILHFPDRVPAGETRDQIVTAMDWFPTILELCKIELPTHPLDGKSLTPVIASAEAPSPHQVLHFQWQEKWAVREGDWKLIKDKPSEENALGLTLRNLADKRPEVDDHSARQPEIVQRLQRLHEQFVTDVFAETDPQVIRDPKRKLDL